MAGPDDAPAVAGLLAEFRDWLEAEEPPLDRLGAAVERLLADPDTEYLLAASAGTADPAAVCQLRYRFGVWYDAEDCLLEDLFVRDSARGAGLGRALVEAAFERARQRGCRRIELDTNEANTAAVDLYESLGFRTFSERFGGRDLYMQRKL